MATLQSPQVGCKNGWVPTEQTGSNPTQATMADPSKLKLTYVHFSMFHKGKTNRLIDLVTEKMEKECDVPNIHKSVQGARMGEKVCVRRYGFLLLHDDKELYCASLLEYTTIQTRWVPPKHRGKGYATLMLQKISEMFESLPHHDHICPWIISYNRMEGINTRAGWVKNPNVNTRRSTGELDPTVPEQHDWFPPWAEASYHAERNDEFARGFFREFQEFYDLHAKPTNLDLKVRL